MARRAADAVNAEFVMRLAQRLVQIRSVVEPDRGATEAAAAEFVAETLRELGLEPTLEEAAPNRPNVICDWAGSSFEQGNHKTLLLEGHSDVVTEGDAADWKHSPFAGIVENGALYGRGSADMKGGVAAAIGALAALQTAVPDLPGRVRLGVVVDEEGLMLGIKHFIRQGHADELDGAIICEPEENELCLFQKGAMRVSVMFRGKMAHGAMPYAGVNPVAALGKFLEDVRALEASEQRRLGRHEHLGFPWFTPTTVRAPDRGEAQHNVMPAAAYLALDIRTVPGQEHGRLLDKLNVMASDLMRETAGLSITLDCFESRPWTETPGSDPLVSALEAAYPLVFDRAPRYGGVPGATDGTFLHALKSVPIVTVGPGDRDIPHQLDEFVHLDEVVAAARLYAAAAVYFFDEE